MHTTTPIGQIRRSNDAHDLILDIIGDVHFVAITAYVEHLCKKSAKSN